MKTFLIICFIILIVGLLHQPSNGVVQAPRTMTITTDGAIGCRDRADADKVQNFIIAHDTMALYQIMRRCRTFDEGEVLVVSETAFSDATCMRPAGSVDCYWINRGWMR